MSEQEHPPLAHAGLQHAVLLRAMPVLRHDLSSPLSVMRMGLMLLKRHLQRPDIDPQDAQARVEQLEQQLAEISRHIKRLRQWDPQVRERHTLHAMALEATGLARPMLMVHGVEVDPVAEDAAGWNAADQAPHTVLYVVMAAIYHLAERPGDTPQHIVVEPAGPRALTVTAHGQSALPDDLKMGGDNPVTERLPMDEAALSQLARMENVDMAVAGRVVTLRLP